MIITFYGVHGSMLHHGRSDAELDEIQIENEHYFKPHYDNNKSYRAAEGIKISLSKQIAGSNTLIEVE